MLSFGNPTASPKRTPKRDRLSGMSTSQTNGDEQAPTSNRATESDEQSQVQLGDDDTETNTSSTQLTLPSNLHESASDASMYGDGPRKPLDTTYSKKVFKIEGSDGVQVIASARHLPEYLPQFPDLARGLEASSPTTGTPMSESRVLVLYTGGTIGMKSHDGVYEPEPNYLPSAMSRVPHLNDSEYVTRNYGNVEPRPFCLPPVKMCDRRILYWIVEYEPLLDSSDMTFDDWIRVAKDIHKCYDRYDGFVVLHGTDTLAYTSSALSFMLENLSKPVIITGSQIPVAEVRSDGRENLIGALIAAGGYDIPEVCVYFNNKLLRGNRCSKCDNSGLNAFDSPNIAPLAVMEIAIKVDYESIFRSATLEPCRVHTNLNRQVGLLRIFPSMSIEAVNAFLSPPMEGVVLQTFGAGNMPLRRLDIIEAISKATARGVIIVNCTQCQRGQVDIHYKTGKILIDAGVVGGSDMTPEAALTKLSYVLGHDDWTVDVKRKAMRKNLRGELTMAPRRQSASVNPMIDILPRLVKFFRMGSSTELDMVKQSLFPALVCTAAQTGDVLMIDALKEAGANISGCDYDRRTALHVAAQHGHVHMIEALLMKGCNVHARDRLGQSALMSAIQSKQLGCIEKLRAAGGHITYSAMACGMEMCIMAAHNDQTGLSLWLAAGVDINAADYDGRTALHVAASRGHARLIKFLLSREADKYRRDNFGNTPLMEAKAQGHDPVAVLLSAEPGDPVLLCDEE